MEKKTKIPKVIHYCWFGDKEPPAIVEKCRKSWEILADKGYTFQMWNEKNFDVNKCRFSADAYKTRNFAFVSDYARWEILRVHGGVYFDTDVMLYRDITPLLRKYEAFGARNTSGMFASGLVVAASAGNIIVEEMAARYEHRNFLTKDGKPIYLVDVDYESAILEGFGFHPGRDEVEMVENMAILPSDYFCANNPQDGGEFFTRNTYAVHKFTSTWKPKFMLDAEKK